MTWKLPKELEQYRDYFSLEPGYESIEEQYNDIYSDFKFDAQQQVRLLQRLIKAGLSPNSTQEQRENLSRLFIFYQKDNIYDLIDAMCTQIERLQEDLRKKKPYEVPIHYRCREG